MDREFRSRRRRTPITFVDVGGLVGEASRARWFRSATAVPDGEPARFRDTGPAESLERQLAGRLPATVDLCRYLTRVATLMQMSSASVAALLTSIAPLRVPSSRARLLAIALNEFMCFLVGCARPDRSTDLCLAVAVDDDRLVVGLAAMGVLDPVPDRGAMAALLRGARLVESAGGFMSRGVEPERIVIGATFDDAALLGAIAASRSPGHKRDG